MNKPSQMIDFSSVLAAAIHDMKNSLCLLRQTIEQMAAEIPNENTAATKHLATAHYEAARLNTGLVQLLSLYRAETENLPINVDECHIDDLIEELLLNNEAYLKHKNMTLTVEVEPELAWFLDGDLVHLLMNDMLVNASRYAKEQICLSVSQQQNFLVFVLQDDGPGYPDNMLKATEIDMQEFDISQGRTGLGLFFARLIAEAHTNHGNAGVISLQNGGKFGGSVFTLKLP